MVQPLLPTEGHQRSHQGTGARGYQLTRTTMRRARRETFPPAQRVEIAAPTNKENKLYCMGSAEKKTMGSRRHRA
eukprot:4053978-Pyramimonas_sp.AAC.1